jgi:rhamnose transport system ATP-binding protein
MLLEAKSISKSFDGVRALEDVSFELAAGEVHALVGENGAGKSTLIRIMTGAIAADSGHLEIDGRTVQHASPAAMHALGIAAIYQQPALFPHLTVAENIALPLETGSPWRRIRWKERNRRASELIARTGASIAPERLASTLSMPEQQIVEIAKALGANARVLIMDEPTASLTDREVERLFAAIALVKAAGAGIIYISHRLEEIAAIADRITVLRDGHAIGTLRKDEVEKRELIAMMSGRELAGGFPESNPIHGDTVIEISNLRGGAAGLHGVSFSIRAGEILGLAGLAGSGRTEVAEALFGLTPADSGDIKVGGENVRIDGPARAIALGIGYVPEDRRRYGVVPEMPVASNVSLASLNAISDRGLIDRTAEKELAARFVEQLQIKTRSIQAETGELSGGNQQKVALARWLATNPRILILDEPTQGVDVGSKAEIYGLIAGLAARGIAILLISSEMPEILGLSDRIAVMHRGAVAGELSRAEATQQRILSLALNQ